MSNGPNARVAESVTINIDRPRQRDTIVKDPAYYKIRNYLVNFLVNRSGERDLSEHPRIVDPSHLSAQDQDKSTEQKNKTATLQVVNHYTKETL